MLGWNISIFRQIAGRSSPAKASSVEGTQLAVWQADVSGLQWLDEFAYITANLEFPGRRFVTIALNNVEFKHPIRCGQILRFAVSRERLGHSSIEYLVEVFGEKSPDSDEKVLFATSITFVNVAESGAKQPITT